MKEIVKIYNTVKIGNEEVNSVNARDLYSALKVESKFADWIKRRLNYIQAEEGTDYIVLKNENADIKGAAAPIEYFITIDLAKEISMLEKNDIGKMIRKYFIECEKQLRQIQPQFKLPQTYKEIKF